MTVFFIKLFITSFLTGSIAYGASEVWEDRLSQFISLSILILSTLVGVVSIFAIIWTL